MPGRLITYELLWNILALIFYCCCFLFCPRVKTNTSLFFFLTDYQIFKGRWSWWFREPNLSYSGSMQQKYFSMLHGRHVLYTVDASIPAILYSMMFWHDTIGKWPFILLLNAYYNPNCLIKFLLMLSIWTWHMEIFPLRRKGK